MTTVEVPVTTITQGRERTYQWDCPWCQKRITAGKHGIASSCVHKSILKARSFDDLVAVFSQGPLTDPQ